MRCYLFVVKAPPEPLTDAELRTDLLAGRWLAGLDRHSRIKVSFI